MIGIITAIVGNILISFALNIQRYAHIRIHHEHEEKKRLHRKELRRSRSYGTTSVSNSLPPRGEDDSDPLAHSFSSSNSDGSEIEKTTYLHSPFWWGGIILMAIGETGNFLAYAFAPASIVSPLGVVALISNCVIAPIMLKEKFRMRDFWGVLVAVGGAVTVVLSAKQEEKRLGPHEVLHAITRLEFEIYMLVTAVLIGGLIWASPRFGDKTIFIDLGLVGLFGGYTALSTKGVASMLTSGFLRAFTTPVTYCLLLVLVGTAVMQIKYVNKALQRFDSTQVIPVQFVLFTLSVIIGSAILYRDFEHTTVERTVKFVSGCLLTFFGVFLITSGRPGQSTHEDDSDSDDEISLASQHASATNGNGINSDYFPDGMANKYAAIDPSPLHQEVHSSPTPSMESFPPLSRRTSKVSWGGHSYVESPSKDRNDRRGSRDERRGSRDARCGSQTHQPRPPNLRVTSASSTLPTEFSPLIDFDNTTPLRPPFDHFTSQNAANLTARSDSALAAVPPSTPSGTRGAISRVSGTILPGPFISPLSSSLSVVIADNLRRGTDIYGSRRRPKLSFSRQTSHTNAYDGSDDEDGLRRIRSRPSTRPSSSPKRRRVETERDARWNLSRSLESDTLLGGGRPRAKSLGHRISEFFTSKSNSLSPADRDVERGTGSAGNGN